MPAKINPRSFLQALNLPSTATVCLVGAGGKTSLMFQLAAEAKSRGDRVLVTTSTKIQQPLSNLYDEIDLTGRLFADTEISTAKIYVAGRPAPMDAKLVGCDGGIFKKERNRFNLVLIEADGAARKPLKGWNDTEPVIPSSTTHTIGILDITTLGQTIDDDLVHRLSIFSEITGAEKGEQIGLSHLEKLLTSDRGLFGKAVGENILFINKVESKRDRENVRLLKDRLAGLRIVAGSIHQCLVHD